MRARALIGLGRPQRALPRADLVDAATAVLLLAASLVALAMASANHWPLVGGCACVVQAGAVALRRRNPTVTVMVALVGLVVYEVATGDPNLAAPPVAVILAAYTFGRHGAPLRHPRRLAVVAMAGLATTGSVSAKLHDSMPNAVSSWLVAVMLPLAVGVLVDRRSVLSRQLAEAAEQLRAERDLTAAQTGAAERHRVARDLHDVVAHCVSVIGGCGRDALADLRRIVGVLRRTDDPDFGAGAGLRDVGRLAERVEAAGVHIRLRVQEVPGLPPELDLVAFRVVQEALTNVVKHAGVGARAHVDVRSAPDGVTVEVINTVGVDRHPFTASGHGLAGMTERVAALGGDLRSGHEPYGGYAVRAWLPLRLNVEARDGPAGTSSPEPAKPRWWRSPVVARWAIVAFWLLVLEAEALTSSYRRGPLLVNVAAVAAMAVAAGWRRRSPLLFVVAVGALAIALSGGLTTLDRATITGLYSLAVPLFTVAAWEPRGRATMGLALWAAGAGIVAGVHRGEVGGLVGAVVMGVVVWAAGRVWRAQMLLHADLTETTARLADERDQRARLAVVTERTRLARDLHGPVAHGVTTMVVQAEAARRALVTQPDKAEVIIGDIERTGRDALAQLRRILGVLRSPAAAPAPTQNAATTFGSTQDDDEYDVPTPERVLA